MSTPLRGRANGRNTSRDGRSPGRHARRLCGELLEPRQLLDAAGWDTGSQVAGPVAMTGSQPTEDFGLFAPSSASGLGSTRPEAESSSPSVVQVQVASTAAKSLAVTFSDEVNAAAQISDGTITSAISLVKLASGALDLQPTQFTYDAALRKLTLNLPQPLDAGTYELRLDGSRLRSTAGQSLLGGRGGRVFAIPTFAAATSLQADGYMLLVDSYSVPSLADWNHDGLTDLIVGEKTAVGAGKIRIYLNSGTNSAPVYGAFTFAQDANGDLSVPGSGCLGVFPRLCDWNQDGKQDLVLGLADGTVQVRLNENTAAAPRFGAPLAVQVGPPGAKTDLNVGARATVAIADWNNDGRADLLVGNLDGAVELLLNEAPTGVPDFRSESLLLDGTSSLAVISGRASVAVVDLNDDGRKDLVLGNTEGQLAYYANVGTDAAPVFNGSQLLQAGGITIDLPGPTRSREFVADVNGDGVPDLLVGAADGLVRQYLGSRVAGATDSSVGAPGEIYAYGFRVESAQAANPWHAATFPLDVNHDGLITLLDALAVINALNAHGPGTLPVLPSATFSPPPYLDCSGDGILSGLDVLMVINDLNAHGPRAVSASPEAEGEAGPDFLAFGAWPDLDPVLEDICAHGPRPWSRFSFAARRD